MDETGSDAVFLWDTGLGKENLVELLARSLAQAPVEDEEITPEDFIAYAQKTMEEAKADDEKEEARKTLEVLTAASPNVVSAWCIGMPHSSWCASFLICGVKSP